MTGSAGGAAAAVERSASAIERTVLGLVAVVADGPEALASLVDGWAGHLGIVTGWVGRILAGLLDVVAALLNGVAGIVGGVPAGIVRVLGGAATLDRALVARGATGIASSFAGAVVVLAGTALALVQRVLAAQAKARRLTDDELAVLRPVFGGSVALGSVRLVRGRSGAFGANARPFTLGNVIYLKQVELPERLDVLVHEVVHVWQHQHDGPRYAAEALGAQLRFGWRDRGAYDWRAEVERGRTSWAELNREAQGSSIQELWASGAGPDDALAQLQARRPWRPSARR